MITQAEASSLAAEQALSRADRIQQELNLALARERFATLVETAAPPCAALGPLARKLDVSSTSTMLETVDLAVRNNPELEALRATRDASRADLSFTKRERLPVVEVQGVGAYIYDQFREEWQQGTRLGVDVSAPIYAGGNFDGRRAEARARVRLSELEIDRVERALSERVRIAWTRITSLFGLAEAQAFARDKLAEEAVAVRRSFEVGLTAYPDLERTEAEFQIAILREIDTRYASREEQVSLLALMGILEESLLPVPETGASQSAQ